PRVDDGDGESALQRRLHGSREALDRERDPDSLPGRVDHRARRDRVSGRPPAPPGRGHPAAAREVSAQRGRDAAARGGRADRARERGSGAARGAAGGGIRRPVDTARMSAQTSPGARLREAVAAHAPLQVPGTINAYCALLAERAGFRAIYLSGAGVANASFGMPDLGVTTMNDVVEDARRITAATALPLLVDADTGWGTAFNIARTTRE